MGGIPIRYLERRRLADGSIAFYYSPPKRARKAGIVIAEALGKDPVKAAERAEALNRRVDDWREGKELSAAVTSAGTIDWLVTKYETSDRFKRLRETTRYDYSHRLRVFANLLIKERRLGSYAAVAIKARHVDRIYLRLQEPDAEGNPTKLAGANGIMRVVRRMFSLAVRWEIVPLNPFSKMGLIGAPSRDVVIPPEHVDLFCAKALEIGRRSMALFARMAYELCQRPIDIRKFPRSRYTGTEIQIRQTKTKRLVWVPLLPDLPELKRMLDETPVDSPVLIIDEETGKPYTRESVSRAFNAIRDAAGLPADYWMADMRRSGLDEAGDASATDDELRALSGHASREVVAVYVKPSRVKAASAIRKRQAYRRSRVRTPAATS